MPILKSEAIKSQSSRVNTVSGATYTSTGFKQSLASALAQAGSQPQSQSQPQTAGSQSQSANITTQTKTQTVQLPPPSGDDNGFGDD